MKTRVFYTVLLLFSVTACTTLQTTPETISQISRKIGSKDFTVVPNYIIPLRMRPFSLSPDYNLKVKNDSAFAFLPYFGVAHFAPIDPTEGGIRFAEPMTDYSLTPNKKQDGWDIHFKVKSKGFIFEIFLSVYNDGSSSFSVDSWDKDPISFDGEVIN